MYRAYATLKVLILNTVLESLHIMSDHDDNQPPSLTNKRRGETKAAVTRNVTKVNSLLTDPLNLSEVKTLMNDFKIKYDEFMSAYDEYHNSLVSEDDIAKSDTYGTQATKLFVDFRENVIQWVAEQEESELGE